MVCKMLLIGVGLLAVYLVVSAESKPKCGKDGEVKIAFNWFHGHSSLPEGKKLKVADAKCDTTYTTGPGLDGHTHTYRVGDKQTSTDGGHSHAVDACGIIC